MPADENCTPPGQQPGHQENNDALLNAIKNKFAAKQSSATTFSPPQFHIPTLRSNNDSAATPTKATTGGFVLPQLQSPSNSAASSPKPTLIIPMLKDLRISNPPTETTGAPKSATIDLSSALSNNPGHQFNPSSRQNAQQPRRDDDTLVIFTNSLPLPTHYGLRKVPSSWGTPSAFARVICHNMKCIYKEKVTPRAPYPVKHQIKAFRFDTKSPDDIVIEARTKYQRQSHT